MRKLTMLGLSLILSVGAFAQAPLKAPKAQKQSAANAKTEQTTSLNVRLLGNDRLIGAEAETSGFVVKKQSTSRALIKTSMAKTKAKTAVTTDKIYAGTLFPSSMLGGGTINVTTGAFNKLYTSSGVHGMGVNHELNEIYSIEYNSGSSGVSDIFYHAYDATSGAVKRSVQITTNADFSNLLQRSVYIPEENAFYGYSLNGWTKLDCSTFTPTVIVENDAFPFGLTYNSKTQKIMALVMNETTGAFGLATVDKATGVIGTPAPISGLSAQYFGAFAYDYSSDNYLFNYHNGTNLSTLYAIDANTLAISTVCNITGAPQTGAMYVDEAKPADPEAPAAAEFVRATFPNGSFTGTVTFTLPTLNQNGDNLNGTLSYTIKAGDEVIATGNAAPGAEVSASYSATAAGEVTFTCVASKDTHVGKEASEVVYIGNDTPAAPKNVKLTPVTVSWDAVTTGVHNGYIDPTKITYTVKINGNVVAEGITATSCPTNLPVNAEIQNYVATVTATWNGLTSGEGTSNDVLFGQPYNEPVTFEPTEQQVDLFTIIDNNNDSKAWTWDPSIGAFSIPYNVSKAMDDYLVLPPVLIADTQNLHKFSFTSWIRSTSYPEKVEVWIGKEPTAEAMTTKIMDTVTLTNIESAKKTLECYFQVPEPGKWYVAVKGVSDKNKFYLYANNFTVEVSDVAAKGPAAVDNLEVIPGAEGALKATVKFNIPTKDNVGNALKGDVTVTIEDDVDYKTVTGAPGSAQTVEVLTIQGDNDITIQPMQGTVLGFPVVASVYTGVEAPGAVTNLDMSASQSGYGIYAKFDAPEEGVDGGYINKADLTYALYQNQPIDLGIFQIDNWVKILDLGNTMEFETTDMLPAGTAQGNYELGIAGENVAGAGLILYTNVILGAPYELPVIEDFSTGTMTIKPIMLNTAGGMKQSFLTAAGLNRLDPRFGEKGPAVVGQGTTDGQFGYFFLPMMSTKGANKAAFELSYFVGACEDVTVYAEAFGVEQTQIFKQSYLMNYPEGFQTLPIELPAQFQDKDWVTITIRCDFSAAKKYFIWNGYKLINMVQKDMVALDVQAPKRVATGTDYNVTVNVANYGLSAANAYSVELYADGEKVAEKAGAELASYANGQVAFERSMSPIATEPVEYYAKVIQNGDANEANNETAVVSVSPKQSALPGATELTAGNSENAVALTWNEPDLTAVTPEPKTDDFEDADAFAAEYGDWVFVDVDEETVGGVQDMDIPGITPGETKGSFWVWDTADLELKGAAAHSGDKFLFTMFSYEDKAVDDWAISPQLYGGEQTITFWARSYTTTYPEKMEVYYSTGSTDPKDFVLIEGTQVDVVPAEWTEYSVDLPDGAVRFAIRSCAANNNFMLFVDDVTYTPAAAFTGEISLKGYDVYRDGVKLNDAPVEKTDFADSNVVEGTTYDYVVVALFEEGAGRASNTATITYEKSGLENLGAAKAIATAKNTIIVRGFAGEKVIVSSADGKVIANGEASEISSISVPAGVYVVKAGDKSVKVVVK